jgi:hypothetical protein
MLRRIQFPTDTKQPLNLNEIEADLVDELARLPPPTYRQQGPDEFAPPAVRSRDALQMEVDLGRLTAEAVKSGYDRTAAEIEAMGVELNKNLDRIESTKQDTVALIEELQAVASQYRQEGQRVKEQIEAHAVLTSEARTTAKALKEKINGGGSSE